MNFKTIVSAIMAMSLGLGNVAYAQHDNQRDDRGRAERNDNQRGDGDQRNNRGNRYERDNSDEGRVYAEGSHNDRYQGERHRYQKGERLPPEYRGRQYVVENWREHRLSPPPRGYQWVQSGGDYVLAAVATGLILQVLLNN
ncbi:MAG: RcnB family protein [Pseudomonadota bacterium]